MIELIFLYASSLVMNFSSCHPDLFCVRVTNKLMMSDILVFGLTICLQSNHGMSADFENVWYIGDSLIFADGYVNYLRKLLCLTSVIVLSSFALFGIFS